MAYGPNVCIGGAASASTVLAAGYEASKAFDGDIATFWQSLGTTLPHWIKYTFPEGVTRIVTQYIIREGTSYNADWHEWTFQGSNDDVVWTDIDFQTGQDPWGSAEVRTFNGFVNTTAYHYYRYLISASHFDGGEAFEIEMMESVESGIVRIPKLKVSGSMGNYSRFISGRVSLPALSGNPYLQTGNIVTLINGNDPPGEEIVTDETGRIWAVPHLVDPPSHNVEASADGPFSDVGSIRFDNSSVYIQTDYTPNLDIRDQDFTFECWHKTDVAALAYAVPSFWEPRDVLGNEWTGAGLEIGIQGGDGSYVSAHLQFPDYNGSPSFINLADIQPLRTEWKHFAVVRRGKTVYGFDHGVKTVQVEIPSYIQGVLNPAPLSGILVGKSENYDIGFVGNISGIKLTVGEGRWIHDFVPDEAASGVEGFNLPRMVVRGVVSNPVRFITGNLSLPLLTVKGELAKFDTFFATLNATIPAIEGVGYGGGYLDLSIEAITIQASGDSDILGWLNSSIPAITISASALLEGRGYLSASIPAIRISARGFISPGASLNLSIPAIRITANGISGFVGSLNKSIGAITLDAFAYWAGSNVAHLTIPAITLDARARAVVEEIIALALNTKNFGLTKYTSYDYNSLCVFNGSVLGAKSGGIYNLSDVANSDEQILWNLKTGKIGMHNIKLREVWLFGRLTGDLIMTVETAEGARYEYDVEPVADTEDSVRIKIGKGLVSEYIVIEFKNESGETVVIDKIQGYGMKL